jgi:hypothetical protein
MFGWFRAKCPVEPERQAWLERGLTWLCGQFGGEGVLRRKVIEPTPEFFPDPYDGTPESAAVLFGRVCDYMGVDRRRARLTVYEDGTRPKPGSLFEGRHEGAAGLYHGDRLEGETIAVERSQLENPMSLVGTLAHELGHVHLLGDGRLSPDCPDHEPLTDLLTVVLGLGVFVANSVVQESHWRSGQYSGWSVGRQGYLDARDHGYAHALLAVARGEPYPAWARHLRPDARAAFKQGVRFLTRAGGSGFRLSGPPPADDEPFPRRAEAAPADDPDDDLLPWERR